MAAWGFGFLAGREVKSEELPDIFPLDLVKKDFTRIDIISTWAKILTDTLERTWGLDAELEPLLWDSCVQDQSAEGLVTLLATALTDQTDLFLVYVPSVKIVRRATNEEQQKIIADYKAGAKSTAGVYVSFKKYRATEMLKIYSALEYCVLASLHKTLNIAKAIQIKINDLRKSVSLNDSAVAKAQARDLALALQNGRDVYMDSNDQITTATPDTSSTEKAISFLDAKRAFYLNLPVAYISGVLTPGIGSTGEADTKAIDRGLRIYFASIIQPVLFALFGKKLEFKSQDFAQLSSAMELLKTFDLVQDGNIISIEAKREIIQRAFDLDPAKENKLLEEAEAEADKRARENAERFRNNPPPANTSPASPGGGPVAEGNEE